MNGDTPITFGECLGDLLALHGLTAKDLAQRISVVPEVVQRWVSSKRPPPPLDSNYLSLIAAAMELTDQERSQLAAAQRYSIVFQALTTKKIYAPSTALKAARSLLEAYGRFTHRSARSNLPPPDHASASQTVRGTIIKRFTVENHGDVAQRCTITYLNHPDPRKRPDSFSVPPFSAITVPIDIRSHFRLDYSFSGTIQSKLETYYVTRDGWQIPLSSVPAFVNYESEEGVHPRIITTVPLLLRQYNNFHSHIGLINFSIDKPRHPTMVYIQIYSGNKHWFLLKRRQLRELTIGPLSPQSRTGVCLNNLDYVPENFVGWGRVVSEGVDGRPAQPIAVSLGLCYGPCPSASVVAFIGKMSRVQRQTILKFTQAYHYDQKYNDNH